MLLRAQERNAKFTPYVIASAARQSHKKDIFIPVVILFLSTRLPRCARNDNMVRLSCHLNPLNDNSLHGIATSLRSLQ